MSVSLPINGAAAALFALCRLIGKVPASAASRFRGLVDHLAAMLCTGIIVAPFIALLALNTNLQVDLSQPPASAVSDIRQTAAAAFETKVSSPPRGTLILGEVS